MLKIKSALASLGITFQISGSKDFILTYFYSLTMLAIAWFLPNTQQWMADYNPALNEEKTSFSTSGFSDRLWPKLRWRPTMPFALIIGTFIFISLKAFLSAKQSEFLYFNF